MIYGDKEYKDGELKMPSAEAIMQSSNLYVYGLNNSLYYIDSTGDIAYPGQIHNVVVNHIQAKYSLTGMLKDKMIDYPIGFGFADLVNVQTGEVWEVKRNTLSVTKAQKQLKKYTDNHLHDKDYKDKELITGGSAGTIISSDSFVMKINIDTYYVNYWDYGNGIIQYDYYKVTDWEVVGEIAAGIVIVGGITFIIIITDGVAAPVLLPLL